MALPHDIPLSSVDPSARLPRLSALPRLSLAQRRIALGAWVAWYNGHRDAMPDRMEVELDDALHQLEEDMAPARLSDLQARFDAWLRVAGTTGEGEGPDEREHSPEGEIDLYERTHH